MGSQRVGWGCRGDDVTPFLGCSPPAGLHEDNAGALRVPLDALTRDCCATLQFSIRVHCQGVTSQDSRIHLKCCPRGFGRAPGSAPCPELPLQEMYSAQVPQSCASPGRFAVPVIGGIADAIAAAAGPCSHPVTTDAPVSATGGACTSSNGGMPGVCSPPVTPAAPRWPSTSSPRRSSSTPSTSQDASRAPPYAKRMPPSAPHSPAPATCTPHSGPLPEHCMGLEPHSIAGSPAQPVGRPPRSPATRAR